MYGVCRPIGDEILYEINRHDHSAMLRFLPFFLMFFFACSVQAESHVDDAVKDLREGEAKSYFDMVRGLAEDEKGGDPHYQYELGVIYAKGKEAPKDDAKAVRWFRKVAEQGAAMGQFMLGVMYATGEGISKDDVQAYAWSSIAAARGYKPVKRYKETLVTRMTSADIAETQKLSSEYWENIYGSDRKAK